MGIITWIVFGLIAGAVAKLLMPGKDPGGFIVTTLLGIVGAVIGGFIGTAVGLGGVTGFNLGSFIIAVIGAIVLLIIYRMLARRGRA
ncbi:MAG TPA: GlsB/YeaQ/YmgE family stress response membrane protein [Gammaproteobacteria bacterium]|nr:GlsB/YeaQ/YmgE family stress response membrane protein [Gammaproteobacteria bacterium]